MHRVKLWSRALTAGLALAAAGATAGETFTYTDLVKRLTDLEAPAVLPVAGEKCQQWASWDRGSKYDEKSGKYIGWDANGDGGGIIRKEGNLSVFAEMEGPGVIWRTWSAAAGDGHVKIYLDGATEPAVDLPFKQYFNGTAAPFQGKALCNVVAAGWNCYVPIPFQKSCKIVAEEKWGNYYHFTYTTYPKDTVLPTFTRNLTPAETEALAKANDFLEKQCSQDPAGARPGAAVEDKTLTVPAGQTVTVAELTGPQAVTGLQVKLDVPEKDIEILRELCLRITWDDDTAPAVWSPLGDFFGSAPGVNLYKSLPLGMTADGFYAYWYMPFAKRAKIELVNDGKAPRTLQFKVSHAPLTKPVAALGRFHAKWHRDAFLPQDPERAKIDWTMLKAQGTGRFMGVMLHVWNPRGGWWGEGDEKFFVDGEKFPSTFGTGSEDYFGYAWCCPQLFQNAYHNQPRNDGNNKGQVCVNRWHITDNVPFQTGFEAVIEKYYVNARPTLYALSAYWYQAAGQADAYPELPLSERTGWYVAPPAIPGVLEAEELKVLEKSGGSVGHQGMENFGAGWSQDQNWWVDGKPGDRLVLALPVKQAGKFRLSVNLTKACDYGIAQITLDGQKLGTPHDFYNPKVVPYLVDLGVQELTPGEHKLGFEITGCNEKAVKKYMVGIDYVKLEPVKEAAK